MILREPGAIARRLGSNQETGGFRLYLAGLGASPG